MATTELKTVEKLVKEILDIVKGSEAADNKSIEDINAKLDVIAESNNSTTELVKKVEKLSTKVDKKSKDYIKEIHDAFDTYQQKKAELLSDTGISDSSDMKDFVAIITNEMLELKSKFESFSVEFSDLSLNTTMATSKEIISMKNHVLSLNDSIENVKTVFETMKWNDAVVLPVSNSVDEIFTSALNAFKESIFGIMAKIMDGVDSIISKASDNAKIVEGFENLLNEVIQNQQKNKDEILKIVSANVAEENNKLLPKIVQVISSISFDENAEDIKECIDSVGDDLEAVNNNVEVVNQNLEVVNQNIETISSDVETVVQQVEDINQNIETTNKDIEVVAKHVEVANQNIETNITTSNEILEKVEALREVVGPEITTEILEQVNKINSSVGFDMSKKISKINETLDAVTNDFNVLTKGSKEDADEYVYTLLDLESDISKVRILLDDLTHSLQDEKTVTEASTKDISEKIATISSHIKQTEDVFTAPDYQAILQQFDALNDDITSISKRTNKLILTSDDSSIKLEKNIEDFQNILRRISVTVKNFENSSVIKNISLRTSNIQKMVQTSLQSDRAINEAFIHLAGWVDGTSVELEALKAELGILAKKIDDIALAKAEKPVEYDKYDDSQVLAALETITKKLDDNTKRITSLEKKMTSSDEMKSSIDFLVAQIQIVNENITNNKTLTKKIDKMEKQIQQLLSYVEEEE